MTIDQIRTLCHEMRLYGIKSAVERRSSQALAEGLPPMDFLRLLLEDERIDRDSRKASRLMARARFRSGADLVDFDQTFDRGLSKAVVRSLGDLSFYHNRENLHLIGKTGTGKSYLAVALGRRLCQTGISTRFISSNLLFEEIKAERAAGRYLAWVKNLSRTAVLILDDFGLRNLSHDEASCLMDLLEERYQRGPLVITSQIEPAGWKRLFEDSVMAEALVDRLTHPAQTYVLTGSSYREKLKKTKR